MSQLIELLVLREVNEADIPHVMKLYRQSDMDNGAGYSDAEAMEAFRRFQKYPDYRIYLVWDGDVAVGTFALAILDNLLHGGVKSGLIEAVVVNEDYQGQGVGKLMMREALQVAQQKGCYKVSLSSNLRREQAHQFYDGLGFKRHGISFLMELE